MKKFTKIMSVAVLSGLFYVSSSATTEAANFRDVNHSFWAHTEIKWAQEQGLVGGYEDGTFRPGATLTEAQFMAVLTRFANQRISEQNNATHWADGHYRFAEKHFLPVVSGSAPSQRNASINRGDLARVISAYRGMDLHERFAINWLFENNLSTGQNGQTYYGYGADGTLTRAQLVTFMYRMNELSLREFRGLSNAANGAHNSDVGLPKAGVNPKTGVNETGWLNIKTVDELMAEVKPRLEKLGYENFEIPNQSEMTKRIAARRDGSNFVAIYTTKLNDSESIKRATVQVNGVHPNEAHEAMPIIMHAMYPSISEADLTRIWEEARETIRKTVDLTLVRFKVDQAEVIVSINERNNRMIFTIEV